MFISILILKVSDIHGNQKVFFWVQFTSIWRACLHVQGMKKVPNWRNLQCVVAFFQNKPVSTGMSEEICCISNRKNGYLALFTRAICHARVESVQKGPGKIGQDTILRFWKTYTPAIHLPGQQLFICCNSNQIKRNLYNFNNHSWNFLDLWIPGMSGAVFNASCEKKYSRMDQVKFVEGSL